MSWRLPLCRMTSILPKLQLLSKLPGLMQTRSGYAGTWRKWYGTVCFWATSASAAPFVQEGRQQHQQLKHLRHSHTPNTLTPVQSWAASSQQPPLPTQCALFPGFQGACPRGLQPRSALHQGQGFGARPIESSPGELPEMCYCLVMPAFSMERMLDVSKIWSPMARSCLALVGAAWLMSICRASGHAWSFVGRSTSSADCNFAVLPTLEKCKITPHIDTSMHRI